MEEVQAGAAWGGNPLFPALYSCTGHTHRCGIHAYHLRLPATTAACSSVHTTALIQLNSSRTASSWSVSKRQDRMIQADGRCHGRRTLRMTYKSLRMVRQCTPVHFVFGVVIMIMIADMAIAVAIATILIRLAVFFVSASHQPRHRGELCIRTACKGATHSWHVHSP